MYIKGWNEECDFLGVSFGPPKIAESLARAQNGLPNQSPAAIYEEERREGRSVKLVKTDFQWV